MTNQLSKNLFPEIFSDGHLRYSFHKRAIIFPEKVQVSVLKVRTIDKKQFFKVKFPQMFPINTCIAVLAHLDSLFATEQKKCCRSKFLTKNIVSLEKELIFRKTFLWTRGWHLWQLWKKISEWSSYFFCLKFQGNLKQCAKFQTCFFFLKVSQGYVGYSFDNSGELFQQSELKSSLRILKS